MHQKKKHRPSARIVDGNPNPDTIFIFYKRGGLF